MCVGSLRAMKTVDAVAGVNYLIGKTGYGAGEEHPQGVLFQEGDGYVDDGSGGKVVACAACVRQETRVELSGIPQELQSRLGVGSKVRATFVPGGEDVRQTQDKIRVGGRRLFKLQEFADQGVILALVSADARAESSVPSAMRVPARAGHELAVA